MGQIAYHHLTRKVTTISPYKYRLILPQKICNKLAPKAIDIFLSLEEKIDLGIEEAADTPPPGHLVFIVFFFLQIMHRVGSTDWRIGPTTPTRSSLIPVEIYIYIYIYIKKNFKK